MWLLDFFEKYTFKSQYFFKNVSKNSRSQETTALQEMELIFNRIGNRSLHTNITQEVFLRYLEREKRSLNILDISNKYEYWAWIFNNTE